jgi:hypothetical protein
MAINTIKFEDENILVFDSDGEFPLKLADKYPVEYDTSDVREYIISLEPVTDYSKIFDKIKVNKYEQSHKCLYKIHIKDSASNIFTNVALFVRDFHGEPVLAIPTDKFWNRMNVMFDQEKPDWVCDIQENSLGIDLFYNHGVDLFLTNNIYVGINNAYFAHLRSIFVNAIKRPNTQLKVVVTKTDESVFRSIK